MIPAKLILPTACQLFAVSPTQMLDGNEKQNFHTLMRLRDVMLERAKPLVFWVGAGASRWCNYPGWNDLAERFHATFARSEAKYRKAESAASLAASDFPAVFSFCKNANETLYNTNLVAAFPPVVKPTDVYDNFLRHLSAFDPLHIVTTNVDEALEQRLPNCSIVQRSDFERCPSMLQAKKSFICKLHGSISAVKGTVFTAEEYENLTADSSYLSLLKDLFAQATVVFVGYGLKDEYVLRTLSGLSKKFEIFGTGPHFFVTAAAPPDLPDSILPIKYFVGMHEDHRSAVMAIDIIQASQAGQLSPLPGAIAAAHAEVLSGFYISDFTPAGTWTSSQEVGFNVADGRPVTMVVGHGFINSELKNFHSHSPRDFVVGLLCFDRVYLPLHSAAALHDYLGSDSFWQLVNEDVLRFVHIIAQPGYLYEKDSMVSADIGVMGLSGKENRFQDIGESLRRSFKPAPGKENIFDGLLALLESKVIKFDSEKAEVARLVRGALLHPRLRRLLGFSDGILPSAIPRWLVFSALRAAHTVNTAVLCQEIKVAAANVWFGSETLVGATFGLASVRDWAHEAATYVIANQADIDLEAVIDPSVLRTILRFRETSEGRNLRVEVLEQLQTNAGSEFTASVNAGLKRNLPLSSLEKPKRVFATLLASEPTHSSLTRAVSINPMYADSATALWRKRSLGELRAICDARKIGPYDSCPCLSGEKLKFCCVQALSIDI
jgi:hypothetical protein